MGKKAAETIRSLVYTYGESAPSKGTCEYWFRRFKEGNLDLGDKERPKQPEKFEDDQLQALLAENTPQTLKELAGQLNVTEVCVSQRLHAMGKIQKQGRWLPRNLSKSSIA